MARFAPDDQVFSIRNSVNIVDVISEYLILKKAGKNFVGLCPFHAEKTPSFSVSPDKQFYHCFGCGAGGDVFDFVMRQNNMTFPEAMAALAARAGIELAPREMTPEQKRLIARREAIFAANSLARDFFVQSLSGSKAQHARQYLEKREIPKKVMDAFMLGYAPAGWNSLVNHLEKSGVPLAKGEDAGLLKRKEGGSRVYDRFRDRIIFPIMDISGQIAGFGGRVMDDSMPKYLNSPQTPVYDKKRMLYGLYQARQTCRKQGSAFIVEGYFDVLALWANKIQNAVATCGTALSANHVRLLKGYAKKIVLVFDSDVAGINAARKSLPVFEAEKIKAKVLVLPTGHDPDSFVRENGAQAFLDMAENSMDMVPFLVESAIAEHGLSIEGKAKIVADVKEQIAFVSDSVTRSLYIKQLAERLAVDEAAVLDAVREASRTGPRLPHGPGPEPVRNPLADHDLLEQEILRMMVHCPESVAEVAERRLLKYFESQTLKSMGMRILEYLLGGGETSTQRIMDLALTQEERNIIAKIQANEKIMTQDEYVARINQFEQRIAARQGADLNSRIQQAQASGDDDLALRLLVEKNKQLKAKAQKAQGINQNIMNS